MRSSLRRLALPDGPSLGAMTAAVMRGNGLVGRKVDRLFEGPSPITHVIYVIKENRTYDQVLGDVPAAGDGSPADGDPALALFGHGEAARRPGGPAQDVAPNHRALALRFGLFDRFFVNSEASADGHNWATAAYSSDYVDKAFRWNYSGRGRTYDYEGFNRLPDYEPASNLPPLLSLPLTADDVAAFMRRYVPYLNASRDVSEPDSLYIWDAAARAGVTYKSYGEFIGTVSADDIAALNARKQKTYPDISPTVATVPTKLALELAPQLDLPRLRHVDAGRHDHRQLSGGADDAGRGRAHPRRSRRTRASRGIRGSAPGSTSSRDTSPRSTRATTRCLRSRSCASRRTTRLGCAATTPRRSS